MSIDYGFRWAIEVSVFNELLCRTFCYFFVNWGVFSCQCSFVDNFIYRSHIAGGQQFFFLFTFSSLLITLSHSISLSLTSSLVTVGRRGIWPAYLNWEHHITVKARGIFAFCHWLGDLRKHELGFYRCFTELAGLELLSWYLTTLSTELKNDVCQTGS